MCIRLGALAALKFLKQKKQKAPVLAGPSVSLSTHLNMRRIRTEYRHPYLRSSAPGVGPGLDVGLARLLVGVVPVPGGLAGRRSRRRHPYRLRPCLDGHPAFASA